MGEIHIIGAGLAGMTLAVALEKLGFKSTVFEASSKKQFENFSNDTRTTALAYTSSVLFENLGLWRVLKKHSASISSMRVSNDSKVELNFDPSSFSENPMGYITPNKVLKAALLETIENSKNVELVFDTGLLDFQKNSSKIQFSVLQNSETKFLDSDLLIGCDGRHSVLAQLAGFSAFKRDYKQAAIVCELDLEQPHQNQAFQVFTKTGPIALLPLPTSQNRVSLIWSHETLLAKEIAKLDKQHFISLLNKHIGSKFSPAKSATQRQTFPLSAHYLSKFTTEGIALLGEAAHGVHPLAGQGFNLTLRDIACLCEVLDKARDTGQQLGSSQVLKQYEIERSGDTSLMFGFTDLMSQLLSGNQRLPSFARDLGFKAVESNTALKERLTRHAMGSTENLSPLMQENWRQRFMAVA